MRRGVVYFGSEGGDAVRALRADRPREVDVQRLGRDQGLARAVRLHALRRRLQRPHVRGLGAHRPRALVDRHVGPQVRLRAGQLLLDAGGRLRPRLRRQHRQQGLLVRRRTGELAWSKSTGGYVYSSPAVANVAGTRPTVYIGSYDGNLYALDARTGSTRWTARGGGRISGGPTVVGRIVYFADLDSKSTYGVDARTGKRVFKRSRGVLQPGRLRRPRIYMTGYASVTALDPVKKRPEG